VYLKGDRLNKNINGLELKIKYSKEKIKKNMMILSYI